MWVCDERFFPSHSVLLSWSRGVLDVAIRPLPSPDPTQRAITQNNPEYRLMQTRERARLPLHVFFSLATGCVEASALRFFFLVCAFLSLTHPALCARTCGRAAVLLALVLVHATRHVLHKRLPHTRAPSPSLSWFFEFEWRCRVPACVVLPRVCLFLVPGLQRSVFFWWGCTPFG